MTDLQQPGPVGMQPLPSGKLEALKKDDPALPEAYFGFLARYGWGDAGYLYFYEGPGDFSFIYPAKPSQPKLHPFADDQQGYVYCFDASNHYRVVEVDPCGDFDGNDSMTFAAFYREFVLDLAPDTDE